MPATVYDFGAQLLRTNDLDPVYVLLWEARLPRPLLERWLLAYWCFYHVGTASWIADAVIPLSQTVVRGQSGEVAYWDRMMVAASSKDYPRCHERRHFRAANATKAVDALSRVTVAERFRLFRQTESMSLSTVMKYVRQWPQFGPWIAFKAADMLERLDLMRVTFDDAAMFLFDSPREGAKLLWDEEGQPHAGAGSACQQWAVSRLLDHFGADMAPPRYERAVNVQEVETILCKWKSHVGGHYTVGEDIKACRLGLGRFAKRSRTAQCLLRAGRRTNLW